MGSTPCPGCPPPVLPVMPPPAPVAIYPNPATDRLTIELTADETENADMLLRTTSTTEESYIIQLWHERNGMVREIKSTERVRHISLLGLPKGMYFVHVKKEGKVVQKQILWVR
ncbi:MAG: T9SS type A sorting domain-containing protein [Paludibacter sp.]|nr:T9SS type A sorting domain-containing protein [Paludibacter sp.]